LFSPEEIKAAQRDKTKKYFINYKLPSGDLDDNVAQKNYIGEWAMVKNKLVKEGFGVLSWGDGSKYEG